MIASYSLFIQAARLDLRILGHPISATVLCKTRKELGYIRESLILRAVSARSLYFLRFTYVSIRYWLLSNIHRMTHQ